MGNSSNEEENVRQGGPQSGTASTDSGDASDRVGDSDGGSGDVALLKALSEAAESKDRYLRVAAEFENYKKRTMKERSELIRYQGEPIVVELLEVLDGFERALAHADADPATVVGGLKMIHKQFVDALARFEIRAESSIGKPFDPNRQRAIGKEKREGSLPNEVLTELKKGYLYRDKLVRLGEVVVASDE
jgi:molecular chaperone GrpE